MRGASRLPKGQQPRMREGSAFPRSGVAFWFCSPHPGALRLLRRTVCERVLLGAAGSGAAPGDEQPACLAAGSSVQLLGMLPALRAELLSNKCAPHQGTNVTPEISQVNPLHDPLRGIAV